MKNIERAMNNSSKLPMKFIQQCRLNIICADGCIPNDKLLKQTVFIQKFGWVPLTVLDAMKYIVVDVECAENFFALVSVVPRKFRILPFYEAGDFILRSIMR